MKVDAAKAFRYLFAAFLLLVGTAFVALGYFGILKPDREVAQRFEEGRALVLGKETVTEQNPGKRLRRGHYTRKMSKTRYHPEIHIRYEFDGRTFEARTHRITRRSYSSPEKARKVLARFPIGETVPCWYDPEDPERVVLEKGVTMAGPLFIGLGVAQWLCVIAIAARPSGRRGNGARYRI